MIFMVRDKIDQEKDSNLVRHIFNLHSNQNVRNFKSKENVLEVDFLKK